MILIIDFGSQTAHLIGRRLRQLGVTTGYLYPDEVDKLFKQERFTPHFPRLRGIILTGGPASVYENGAPTLPAKIFSLNIPVLGICYGWQLMAKLLGGKVINTTHEYGPQEIEFQNLESIYKLPQNRCSVFLSHGDTVTILPKGFSVFGRTDSVKFAAVADEKRKLFGVQFHPEAFHTEQGVKLLQNFVCGICGETLNISSLSFKTIVEDIGKTVGNKKVICAVSGGVDSTVAALLIGKAIGKNLIPVYIESGLMRPGTDKRVHHIFTKLIKVKPVIIDAKNNSWKRSGM